jgi:LAO/AO transport system kinase
VETFIPIYKRNVPKKYYTNHCFSGGIVLDSLIQQLLEGDRRAVARIISLIENDEVPKSKLMSKIYPHTGKAYILGITGAPGAGKSTLTNRIVAEIRRNGLTVAVIAVDPTSPFTGGAILGDRIRMQSHTLDPEVFIRSMGTRGSLGGLSRHTNETVKVMDAFKKDVIIVETVGVGQSEFDIMHIADTTVVVLNPGAGDAIQSIKAGIMEIADVFIVNKADMDGADRVKAETEAMLDMRKSGNWRPPVVLTAAVTGTGIEQAWKKILEHRKYLETTGQLEKIRKVKIEEELKEILGHEIKESLWTVLEHSEEVKVLLAKLINREIDPYSVAEQIIKTHIRII